MTDDWAGREFIAFSVHTLREHYLPKVREAVEQLEEPEIWLRAGNASNSVGNILLHMAGNLRQHIISGVGGKPDERNRPLEFAARGGVPKELLLQTLEDTVREACAVLEAFDVKLLGEARIIQKNKVILLGDIYHVVEHFAYHVGQIIYAVKAVKDKGFNWYQYLEP
jgi:hypothetical protein